MSKIILCFLLLVLSSCNWEGDYYSEAGEGFVLFVDEQTGCEYIRMYLSEGITPRFDPNGKQICREIKYKTKHKTKYETKDNISIYE